MARADPLKARNQLNHSVISSTMERGMFPFISLFLSLSIIFIGRSQGDDSIILELVHRHWSKPSLEPGSTESFFRSDVSRAHAMADRISSGLGLHRRGASESIAPATLPLSSAADDHISQYYVKLKVGTPASEVTLIADTGSHLTWLHCPKQISPLLCSSNVCGDGQLADLFQLVCQYQSQACLFDAGYMDGTKASGYFFLGNITLPRGKKLIQVLSVPLGCVTSQSRASSFGTAVGVMGLGFGVNSIVDILYKEGMMKFSYCLMDHTSPKTVSSYLIFSNDKSAANQQGMSYTKLGLIDTLYAVQVSGISLDGQMLGIRPWVWSSKGLPTTVLDSGASLTFLVYPAYIAVRASMENALRQCKKKAPIQPFSLCFDAKSVDDCKLPKLAIHFKDGAVFSPPTKNYLIKVNEDTRCMGFLLASGKLSTVGSILMQNHIWEFDIHNAKLGYASSECVYGRRHL